MTSTAFVFPGQGAQFVGMGKDSFDTDKAIQETYNKADKIFAEFHTNSNIPVKSISQVSFTGPEELLTRTLYTQPSILTLSIALATKLKEQIKLGKITKPNYVAGHSLGEFAALYMADVLSLEDVIKLVAKRADLMEQAPAGAMSAIVGMEEAQLATLLVDTEGASVANYNAPDQVVITGTKAGVEALGNKINDYAVANSLKVRVIPLNVGGAFHSPLMKAASEEFAKLIDACNFNNATIPVIQNINAEPVTSAVELKANLKQQMCGSVRWTQTVKFLLARPAEVEEIWEIGPGKVLAGLVKKQERRFAVKNIASVAEFEAALNPAIAAG